MPNKFSQAFHKWTSGRLVLVLLILSALLLLAFRPAYALLGGDKVISLDEMVLWSPACIFQMIGVYGAQGRAAYRIIELSLDLIFPVTYFAFFGLGISWLSQRGFSSTSKIRRLNVVPLGAWLADFLENLTIVILLSIYPFQPVWMALLLIIFNSLKWIFLSASLALVLICLVAAARNGFKRQS